MICIGCKLVTLLAQLVQFVMYKRSCSHVSNTLSCATSITTVRLQLPGGKERSVVLMQASPIHWLLQLVLNVAFDKGEKPSEKLDS